MGQPSQLTWIKAQGTRPQRRANEKSVGLRKKKKKKKKNAIDFFLANSQTSRNRRKLCPYSH